MYVAPNICQQSPYHFFFAHFYFPASGQAVVTGVVPSSPRFLPSICIAHRVHQSHCSSIFHRVLLTHALALSASQFVHTKKSTRIYTSMHSGGFELTKLTYTRFDDNLIRHRGDRFYQLQEPLTRSLKPDYASIHRRPKITHTAKLTTKSGAS